MGWENSAAHWAGATAPALNRGLTTGPEYATVDNAMGRLAKTTLVERDSVLTRVLISDEEYAELKRQARSVFRMPTAEYLGRILRLHLESYDPAQEEANSNAA